MSLKLKSYPEYKDSGVPWLDEIPAHWWAQRLKRIAYLNPSKSEARGVLDRNEDVTFLPMEKVGNDGRIDAGEQRPVDLVWNGFTYFQKNDVLLAKITPCFENGKGACLDLLPTPVGFGSTEFTVLRPRATVVAQFLYRITSLARFRQLGADEMTGSAGQQRVPNEFVGNFVTPVPPISEQECIARFLDRMDRLVDRLIRAKQRLIELLNEQKQAIIHRAVMQGLDPDVPMKPTGLDWLPEVPEHWNVVKLSRIARVFNGTTPSRMQPQYWENGTIPWLSSGKVNDYIVEEPSELITQKAFRECSLSLVPRGSVIIGMIGQGRTRGMSAFLNIDTCVNQNLAAIVPNRGIRGRFLHQVMMSLYQHIRNYGRGGNQEALNSEIVSSLKVPLAPQKEQDEILVFVDRERKIIDAAIQRAQREIELIREYRTRLISDVVTGKLDVRGVELPGPEEEGVGADLDGLESVATEGSPDSEEVQDAAFRY